VSWFHESVVAHASRYRIKPSAKLRLLAHYPLFKAWWLAIYGTGAAKAAAKQVMRAGHRWRFSHQVPGAKGGQLRVPVGFGIEELVAFRETFMSDTYWSRFDLSKCRTYVDLGANLGLTAMHFATQAPLDVMVLVEPNPALVPVLKANVADSGINARVVIEPVAIADGRASVEFSIGEAHRMGSTHYSHQGAETILVPATTLGALLDRHGLQSVDIIKIDIEGAENELDLESLRRCRFIFAEVHGAESERDAYVQRLQDAGIEIVQREAADEMWKSEMLLALGSSRT
jgi:FkbM family methyltransferase